MISVKFSYFEEYEMAEMYCNEKEGEVFEILDDIVQLSLGDKTYCFYTKELAQALKPFIK
jgi:hypothetical protein